MSLKTFSLLCLLALATLPVILIAQKDDRPKPVVEPDPELSVTKHQVRLQNGQLLNYTATTGYLILRKETGESRAKIFFIAYTKDGETNPAARPVTYTFNGGPGSSSVWLHMGALGPRRILMTEKGDATTPPYQYAPNEHTWLEWTDLVFIDPVETGYSRPAEGVDKKEFLGYEEDLQSVGDFIRLYTSRYTRWNSPKYLAGESYGTTRATGLSGYLQDRYGMYLNGLVLISQISNFQTARFERGNDLPYPLFLPTYAATAWYHGKVKGFAALPDLLKEVEAFALNDYTLALMQGERLSAGEKERIAAKLATYTGLPKTYVLQSNLRIQIQRFTKELRRDEGLTVGRLDSRFTASDYDDAGENYEFDPSYNGAIYGPYSMSVNDYLKRELKYSSDLPYEILTGRVQPWNYNNVQNRYLNTSETMRNAIHKNPHLKVLICNGYYDLATPYFATQYTLDHLFIDEALRKNIQMKYYEAGHMMYIHKPSLEQFTADVRAFYKP